MDLLNARRAVALLCCVIVTTGATRYVKPGGTDSGTALTEATAWGTMAYALSNSSALASGDTLLVMDGEWTGDDVPYGVTVHSSKAGTAGDWTYVLPDTGATPVFDWTGNTGVYAIGMFFDQFSPRFHVEGLTFQDYPDSTAGSSGATKSVFNVKAALGNDLVGFRLIDCTFEAEDADSIDGAFYYFANSNVGSAEYLDSLVVRGNVVRGAMNTPVAFGPTRGAIIEGNLLEGHITNHHRSVDGPNGIQMSKYGHENTTIVRNRIRYYDHGAEVHGDGGLFAENVITDLSDDFLWLHDGANSATMGRRATRAWTVRDNLFAWGEDEGIDLGGESHRIYHNTIVRCGDWMINLGEDSGTGQAYSCADTCDADNNLVTGNLFLISADGADGGGGLNAVRMSSGHSGNVVTNNLFFDPTGGLQFWDQDDVGVTNLATFNAKSYASGNLETDPVLVDTTVAASKPFAAGYTPTPRATSPALGLGIGGRTAGSEPCYECPWFSLNVAGADSVHLSWRTPTGVVGGWRVDAGIREVSPGTWVADIDPRSLTSGVASAIWAVFSDGESDSLSAVDQATVTRPTLTLR